jgi:hypothetical protein
MQFSQRTAPFLLPNPDYKSHVCKQSSFKRILWDKALIEDSAPVCSVGNIVLVGNKCDLTERREVTYEEGKALADANGWTFFETSAKANINVTETFMAAARLGLRLRAIQLGMVRCRKVDFSGKRWEAIWAEVQGYSVAYVKDKKHCLSSKDAFTIAIPGCKCKTLDAYEGSHHILVISPASDANKVPVHHALCPTCRVHHAYLCAER